MSFVNILSKEIKSEYFYYILFYTLWSSSLFDFVQGAFLHIPLIGSFRDEFVAVAICVLIIGSLPYIVRNLNFAYLVAYICIAISYQMCFAFFPYNGFYLQEEGFRFLCTVLPFVFLGSFFDNTEKNMSVMDRLAILSIFLVFLYNVVLGKSRIESHVWGGNMVASYNLLPQCLVVLTHFLYKKNVADAISFAVGMFLLFGFGSRGPIVASAFCGVLLLSHSFMHEKKKIALSILTIGCFVWVIIRFFSNQLMELFVKIGLSTRVFERLLYAEKVESSGRDIVYDKVWNGIDFLQMHGFAGDRYLLDGAYSHNLFLEMWYSFGILGGSLILLSIFTLVFVALYCSEKRDSYFLIVLISFVFGQLMFSGSFLKQGWLYFLIGYSFNVIIKSRQKNRTSI